MIDQDFKVNGKINKKNNKKKIKDHIIDLINIEIDKDKENSLIY